MGFFKIGSDYVPRLALNLKPPDLSLLSSKDQVWATSAQLNKTLFTPDAWFLSLRIVWGLSMFLGVAGIRSLSMLYIIRLY
jgi:hypothetical protein